MIKIKVLSSDCIRCNPDIVIDKNRPVGYNANGSLIVECNLCGNYKISRDGINTIESKVRGLNVLKHEFKKNLMECRDEINSRSVEKAFIYSHGIAVND